MNQAIFKQFLISNDLENGLQVDAKPAAPFAQLQEPIKDDLVKINHASPERAKMRTRKNQHRISHMLIFLINPRYKNLLEPINFFGQIVRARRF